MCVGLLLLLRTGLQTLGELDVDDDDDDTGVASSQVLHTSGSSASPTKSAAPAAVDSSDSKTVATGSLAPPEELVTLGDDLLSNEDIEALLDFDDDVAGDSTAKSTVGDGSSKTDALIESEASDRENDDADVVEDFSDDESW